MRARTTIRMMDRTRAIDVHEMAQTQTDPAAAVEWFDAAARRISRRAGVALDTAIVVDTFRDLALKASLGSDAVEIHSALLPEGWIAFARIDQKDPESVAQPMLPFPMQWVAKKAA